jgi:hypothetical protein
LMAWWHMMTTSVPSSIFNLSYLICKTMWFVIVHYCYLNNIYFCTIGIALFVKLLFKRQWSTDQPWPKLAWIEWVVPLCLLS